MFTGIVECLGKVTRIGKGPRRSVSLIEVRGPAVARGARIGASVAVNGVCLTVIKNRGPRLAFHVMTETKRRSTLGELSQGSLVNLERPLKYRGRIEGHFVLGHVDGMGCVRKIQKGKRQSSFLIQAPARLRHYLIEKGSIAIDGVSLTIGKVRKSSFWVHCIPHTLRATTFGSLKEGSKVNLEADILIKFFEGL